VIDFYFYFGMFATLVKTVAKRDLLVLLYSIDLLWSLYTLHYSIMGYYICLQSMVGYFVHLYTPFTHVAVRTVLI